jgi:hypothetical protein
MKTRTAIALAGALVAVAASTAAAAPALASGTAAGGPRPTGHILRFTGTPTRYHFYNRAQTLGFEVDRDTYHGKVIAWDIVDFVAGGESDLSLALRNGFLYGQFTVGKSGTISGSITGGSAHYQGDTGTIGGTAKPKAAYVVISYLHG